VPLDINKFSGTDTAKMGLSQKRMDGHVKCGTVQIKYVTPDEMKFHDFSEYMELNGIISSQMFVAKITMYILVGFSTLTLMIDVKSPLTTKLRNLFHESNSPEVSKSLGTL